MVKEVLHQTNIIKRIKEFQFLDRVSTKHYKQYKSSHQINPDK